MTKLAGKCVPFTPSDRKSSKTMMAIMNAAVVYRRDQEPFNLADDFGDLT